MTHKEILAMIETVDPNDRVKLNAIDVEVAFYLGVIPSRQNPHMYFWGGDGPPQYTRSRDALKAIRPTGWMFQTDSRGLCESRGPVNWERWSPQFRCVAATEELAELHAIMQAIAHERQSHD